MKIGIIGPVDLELQPFLEKMRVYKKTTRSMLTFYEGTYADKEVIAVRCGVCKVNAAVAAQILIDNFGADRIFVTGTAGGVYRSLKIGDTVIVSRSCYRDVAPKILMEYHPNMSSVDMPCDPAIIDKIRILDIKGKFKQKLHYGRIATGESFVEGEEWEVVEERYDALCVDMETAGVAQVCYVNSIPYNAIRSITDCREENGEGAFMANLPMAAANSVDVLCALLESL